MSSAALETSVYYQGADFVLPSGTYPDGQVPVSLFTIPGTEPARIESVYIVAQYGSDTAYGDVFVLRLLDVSGNVVAAQASAFVAGPIETTYELTWVRQGVDTAADGGIVFNFEDGENTYGWWTGRLPDLVLRPGSMIELQAFRGQTTEDVPDLPMTNIAIVYTPGTDTATEGDTPLTALLLNSNTG